MKNNFNTLAAPANSKGPSLLWQVPLALLITCASLGFLAGSFFPGQNGPMAIIAAKLGVTTNSDGRPLRVPDHQLRADARSMVAAISWLMSRQPREVLPLANQDRVQLALTNYQPLSQESTSVAAPAFWVGANSNQLWLFIIPSSRASSHI